MNGTAIIDYGLGNLFSLQNALAFLGENCVVTSDRAVIEKSARVILPGVGAFPEAMDKLTELGLVCEDGGFLIEQARKKPFLGICLGMQLLFQTGYEHRVTRGLGLIPGAVKRIDLSREYSGLPVPHMGWNKLTAGEARRDCPIGAMADEEYVYFVHSFAAECPPECVAYYAEYGNLLLPALVCLNNVTGCQFHPEKSGDAGLAILKEFCAIDK